VVTDTDIVHFTEWFAEAQLPKVPTVTNFSYHFHRNVFKCKEKDTAKKAPTVKISVVESEARRAEQLAKE
jgi:hypothetical protein